MSPDRRAYRPPRAPAASTAAATPAAPAAPAASATQAVSGPIRPHQAVHQQQPHQPSPYPASPIAGHLALHDHSYHSGTLSGIGWRGRSCVLDSPANQCFALGVFVGRTVHWTLLGTARRRSITQGISPTSLTAITAVPSAASDGLVIASTVQLPVGGKVNRPIDATRTDAIVIWRSQLSHSLQRHQMA